MNDQLIMENYLLILKSTTEVYVHGTLESSNEEVRELLKAGLDNTMAFQADSLCHLQSQRPCHRP